MRASNPPKNRSCFGTFVLLALVALLAFSQHAIAEDATGYDISLAFDTLEQTLSAARYYDREGSGFSVSHVHEKSLSMYTTSQTLANSFNKRSSSVTIKRVVPDYEGYYSYHSMTEKLLQWNTTYPEKFRLWSLGTSVQGRSIWACEISNNPGDQAIFKPNVKYVGNMHGDEVVGRELLMNFLEVLVVNPDANARLLLSSANVFVVPTMNPDGFANGVRANANGIDLNRNFPDQYRTITGRQKEVTIMMNFLASKQWTLSANFHGGDLVANYPWDGRPDGIFRGENKSPDDDTFRFISETYSRTNDGMMSNNFDSAFHNGTVNGAAWYVLFGGMQDFNYIHHGCMEITLEVSVNKWPPASELPDFWAQNQASMFNYLSLINTGIRGRVFDRDTNQTITGAKVSVINRQISKITVRPENGAWFRILPPGATVAILFEAPGYGNHTEIVTIPQNRKRTESGFYQANYILLDVYLSKGGSPVVSITPAKQPAPAPTSTPAPSPTIVLIPEAPTPVSAAPSPVFPLLSSVDSWAVPMFGIAGAFFAIVIGLTAYSIFQLRSTNTSFAQLSTARN